MITRSATLKDTREHHGASASGAGERVRRRKCGPRTRTYVAGVLMIARSATLKDTRHHAANASGVGELDTDIRRASTNEHTQRDTEGYARALRRERVRRGGGAPRNQ